MTEKIGHPGSASAGHSLFILHLYITDRGFPFLSLCLYIAEVNRKEHLNFP